MPVGLLNLLENIDGTRSVHTPQVSESQHRAHSCGNNQLGKEYITGQARVIAIKISITNNSRLTAMVIQYEG